MINPAELRIGNWVDTVTAGLDFGIQVSGIYEGQVCFADGDMFDPKYVSPIPLSPDILLACGFQKVIDGFEKNECGLFPDGIGYYHVNSDFLTRIDHLHTLQKWWFVNTSEELYIKLPL